MSGSDGVSTAGVFSSGAFGLLNAGTLVADGVGGAGGVCGSIVGWGGWGDVGSIISCESTGAGVGSAAGRSCFLKAGVKRPALGSRVPCLGESVFSVESWGRKASGLLRSGFIISFAISLLRVAATLWSMCVFSSIFFANSSTRTWPRITKPTIFETWVSFSCDIWFFSAIFAISCNFCNLFTGFW